ncbi:hypothetical protein C2U69_31790 [Cupriavidus pinatubonensis]|nr:hypothetical protein C2U69_31790 [Cupriavidus pinatubonensis]
MQRRGGAHSHRVVGEDRALAQEGRVSDIVVLAPPPAPYSVGSLAAETAEYVLLNAGRPVLLVPSAYEQVEMEHIVIAWGGWREAARAMADAMPLLLCAERITIVAVTGTTGLLQSRCQSQVCGNTSSGMASLQGCTTNRRASRLAGRCLRQHVAER